MSPENKRAIAAVGIDMEEALDRFMNNEALLERFLKKFLQDPNYAALCEALDAGDCEGAFRAAHTLKGVCGNLSMRLLYQPVSEQVELLRCGNLEAAKTLRPQIDQAYADIEAALRRL